MGPSFGYRSLSHFRDLVRTNLPPEWFGSEQGPSTAEPDVVTPTARIDLSDFLLELMPTIGADGIAVAFREGERFFCRASQGRAPQVDSVIEPGVGLSGVCIEQGRKVVEQALPGELRSVVAAPIYLGPRLVGCIAAFSERAGAFGELEVEMVVAIAGHLGEYERRPSTVERLEALTSPTSEPRESGEADDYLGRLLQLLYPSHS